MKCFYHNDADGKCAAFWVHLNVGIKDTSTPVDFISINYNDRFPIETITPDEQIWIVDFSIPVEDMKKLLEVTKDVTWIDHHKSSIDKYEDFGAELNGIRYDGVAGCELTYAYIHWMTDDRGGSGKTVKEFDYSMLDSCPSFTRFIGDWDVWKFEFGDDTRNFMEAFRMAGEPEPASEWWTSVYNSDFLLNSIKIGATCREHSEMLNKVALDKWGYEARFEGHTILVCNSTVRSSPLFGDRIKDYPFVSAYTHDGKKFSISLYSVNMDVRDLAEKHGGGGHNRACGFVSKFLPFVKIK